MTTPSHSLPLVVVGAGPIGLAAAAHAQSRGLPTVVLEAGPTVASAVREWGHVRLFSSWAELVDPAAEALLADWVAANPAFRGPAWACGQEAALRALHIALALALLDADHAPTPAMRALLTRHARRIAATRARARSWPWRSPVWADWPCSLACC